MSEANSGSVPSLMRTWYHLGTPMASLSSAPDMYAADVQLPRFAPHSIDAAVLNAEEAEDGLRALAGQVLRREVYGVDVSGHPRPHPFQVVQFRYLLNRSQPSQGESAAAFAAVCGETATWTYEEQAADPRLSHQLVLTTDAYNRPTREISIGYARRAGAVQDVTAQDRYLLEVQERSYADFDSAARFELTIPIEGKHYELVGVRPTVSGMFTREQLTAPAVTNAFLTAGPSHVDLSDDAALGPKARLLSWERSYYWNDARDAALALGTVGTLILVHHEEAACFAPSYLADVLGGRIDATRLTAMGYRLSDGIWWQVEETHGFAPPGQFSQRVTLARADGALTKFSYDPYFLVVQSETNPLNITVQAELDYQQVAPWRITDANGNVSEVRYDPLGVIVAVTTYGHVLTQSWGFDPLAQVVARAPAQLAQAIANPDTYLQGAAQYVWYDLDAWTRDGTPAVVLTLTQESLPRDGSRNAPDPSRIQVVVTYVDGLGRTLQKKLLVESGPAVQRDGAGKIVVDAGGQPVLAQAATRWCTSGPPSWTRRICPPDSSTPSFRRRRVTRAMKSCSSSGLPL